LLQALQFEWLHCRCAPEQRQPGLQRLVLSRDDIPELSTTLLKNEMPAPEPVRLLGVWLIQKTGSNAPQVSSLDLRAAVQTMTHSAN
jgi:hypothetical protein